jgi:hypothetical protein
MASTTTYEQILDLFKETDAIVKELAASDLKTRKILDELAEERKKTEHINQETRKILNEIAEEQKKTEIAQQKTEILQQETKKELKELGKQIGKAHRERGTYTELILMPSIEDTLLNVFKFDSFDSNQRRRLKDDEIQLDALGISNSTRNEVMIVEVKTQLEKADIKQLEKNIKRFDSFYPEHKDKKKFGLLVALYASKKLIEQVHQKGFYFATIKDDIIKLDNPKDFKAKAF